MPGKICLWGFYEASVPGRLEGEGGGRHIEMVAKFENSCLLYKHGVNKILIVISSKRSFSMTCKQQWIRPELIGVERSESLLPYEHEDTWNSIFCEHDPFYSAVVQRNMSGKQNFSLSFASLPFPRRSRALLFVKATHFYMIEYVTSLMTKPVSMGQEVWPNF